MLHKPYKDKVQGIHETYAHALGIEDSIGTLAYIAEFKNWAEENNDRQLVLEADLLRAYYYLEYVWEDPDAINYLIAIAEKGKKEKVPNIEERAVQAVAVYYWVKQEYQKAFEWYMRSAELLDKMDAADFPNMSKHLNLIGESYYHFRDYRSALVYFKKSSILKRTSFNYLAVLNAQNTVGLCYQKLEQFDLAKQWFTKVIDDTSQHHSPVWKGIASGNLGYNYYLQGNYEEAIPLLKTDIEYALQGKLTMVSPQDRQFRWLIFTSKEIK